MIKHDPNQSKTVIALIVILVAAIGVTIWRIIPRDEPIPVATPTEASARVTPATVSSAPCTLTRDPFDRPSTARTALKPDAESAIDASITENPWKSRAVAAIRMQQEAMMAAESASPPTPVLPPGSGEVEVTQAVDKPKPASKPRFELLGTVRSGQVYSAIIKSDTSEPVLVEVGDKIGGRYKVVRIESDHAVLFDGKEKTVAKRPQS